MSEAVDNAEVMLSCISLPYKESASECKCIRILVHPRPRFTRAVHCVSCLLSYLLAWSDLI